MVLPFQEIYSRTCSPFSHPLLLFVSFASFLCLPCHALFNPAFQIEMSCACRVRIVSGKANFPFLVFMYAPNHTSTHRSRIVHSV
jgi:hypothetical protein